VLFVVGVVLLVAKTPAHALLHDAFVPLWKNGNRATVAVQEFTILLQSKRAIAEKNASLQKQLTTLHADTLLLSVLQKENKELRALLSRDDSPSRIIASVIVRPTQTPYDTLIIDRGEKHGVEVDDYVFAYDNFFIGQVKAVYGESAIVELYSTPGVTTQMLLRAEENVPIVAEGIGAGNFTAQLPREVVVHQGDSVIIPGIRGGAVGFVGETETTASEPFQTIRFRSPVNMHEVLWVALTSTYETHETLE